MAELDRKKPYGQVINDSEGRFYEQDGVFFTASGEAWTPPGAAVPATAPAKGGKKGAGSQLDAQLQEPA